MEAIPPNPIAEIADTDRFRLFVAGVSDYAIYALSPDGRISSWNLGAQRCKGYTAQEIIGRHFSIFYTDDECTADKPRQALDTALKEGRYEDEGWRCRKDGSRFWAHVVIDPIHDENGSLLGFAKITRDITERKRTQEALRASEERFRLLVQNVTDYAIYMLSPEGDVVNWNAGAARIKGYSADEIVGRNFSCFYTEEARERREPQRNLSIAAAEGRFEGEGWRVGKDGSRFWAHVVIEAIRNDMGELIGFAKVTRDITERKQAEKALQRAQEALFQSQKMEALGKLTGGIAHDFNNLLGVIVTGLELLSHELKHSPMVRIIDSMESAADRAAMLTRQLLAFARRQPLHRQAHNPARVIGSFEAVLRRACSEAIVFEVKLAPQLAPVLIDSTQFEASLLNLVANASDALPEGGNLTVAAQNVQLEARQVGSLAGGAYVRISVSDNGTGMPAEVKAQAVDPFFTTKPPGKGTGLGLSQVYGLVQQCDGELVIDSEVGRGTTVSMYLPAIAGDENGDQTSPDGSARHEKALVVDDQPEMLSLAIQLFSTLGYEVLSANDGAGALDILRRMPDIDVLFSDVLMPGIDGIGLAREARNLVPGIKVVLASGFPVPALNGADLDDAEFDFVDKPYRLAEIARLLRKT